MLGSTSLWIRGQQRGEGIWELSGTREDNGCSGISERGSSVAYLLPRLALQGPLQRLGERPAGEIFETVMKAVDPLVMQVSLSRHGVGGGAQEPRSSSRHSGLRAVTAGLRAVTVRLEFLHFTNSAGDAKEIRFSPPKARARPDLRITLFTNSLPV